MVYCSHKFLRTCVRARFPKEDDAPMTRRISLRRLVAALLALVLVLSLTPAALASASCPQCGGETLCTDNGDGRTHTVSCPEDGYSDLAAPHDFTDNGRCSACGAIDYSKVHITLPSDTAFTAAMGDSDAAISLDGVTLTLGKNNEDVQENRHSVHESVSLYPLLFYGGSCRGRKDFLHRPKDGGRRDGKCRLCDPLYFRRCGRGGDETDL